MAIGDQLRRAFGASAELSGTEQRIKNVTQQYQQFIGIQQSAAKAAETFSVSNQQALSDFSDLASRLGSTGATLKDLENIYAGFNTLLIENAVGSQQAAAAQLQLNQALGAGRLNGEEFNSIAESTPQLLDEIARVTGVARGELKQFAADGGITSQILIQALTNIRTQGADRLAAALDTPAGKLREFNKAISEFQVAVGNELLPVITPLIVETTKLLQAFGELPGPVKTAAVGLTAVGRCCPCARTVVKRCCSWCQAAWWCVVGAWRWCWHCSWCAVINNKSVACTEGRFNCVAVGSRCCWLDCANCCDS